MIDLHDLGAWHTLARRLRIPPEGERMAVRRWFKHRQGPDEVVAALPEETREAFRAAVDWGPLQAVARRDSTRDGASKLALATRDGHQIETVILRIASGRNAVCLSTQAGCAAGCAFCATGTMGLRRNLTAAEMAAQVVEAARLLRAEGRTLRNLVFMGMGEPLQNEEALHEAIAALRDPARFNFADRFILVSTVGIPEAMVRLARRFPGIGVALSLHSAVPEVRRELMPMARRHSLEELRGAIAEVARLQERTVLIEYLLLEGRTDRESDRIALREYLHGLPVHVNLIPYNPIEGAGALAGTAAARRREFAAALKRDGLKVTLRYSLGADVEGACGQLVRGGVRRRAAAAPGGQ